MSRRALILNGASGSVLLVISVVTSFIMSPFLVRELGNASYGFWELIMGLVGYLGILDVGVGPAVVRYVALAHGSGDRAALTKVVNAGLAAFLLAGFVGGVVILATAVRPVWLFGEVPLNLGDARTAIALGAVVFLLTFCRATFSASLMGLQFHRVVNVTRAFTTVVTACFVRYVLPASQPHALVALAALCVCSTFVELVVFSLFLFRHIDRKALNPLHVAWANVRELLGFGVKSAGIMASGSLIRQGVLFVIAHVLGTAAVTFYALACRLIDYSQQLSGAIGFPLTAYFASAFGKGGLQEAREAWLGATRVIQFIQGGVVMGVVLLGVPFLSLWMGPEYARQGAPVFYLLCVGMFMQIFGSNGNRMLVSLNQHGRAALAALGLALFCIALSTVGCMIYGLAGAAGGAALFMSGLTLIELHLVCRALELSAVTQAFMTVRRYLPPIVAGELALWAIAQHLPPTSYIRLPIHAAVGGAAYLAVTWFTALTSDERRNVLERLANRSAMRVGSRAKPG